MTISISDNVGKSRELQKHPKQLIDIILTDSHKTDSNNQTVTQSSHDNLILMM
jgi:hypothetical protein